MIHRLTDVLSNWVKHNTDPHNFLDGPKKKRWGMFSSKHPGELRRVEEGLFVRYEYKESKPFPQRVVKCVSKPFKKRFWCGCTRENSSSHVQPERISPPNPLVFEKKIIPCTPVQPTIERLNRLRQASRLPQQTSLSSPIVKTSDFPSLSTAKISSPAKFSIRKAFKELIAWAGRKFLRKEHPAYEDIRNIRKKPKPKTEEENRQIAQEAKVISELEKEARRLEAVTKLAFSRIQKPKIKTAKNTEQPIQPNGEDDEHHDVRVSLHQDSPPQQLATSTRMDSPFDQKTFDKRIKEANQAFEEDDDDSYGIPVPPTPKILTSNNNLLHTQGGHGQLEPVGLRKTTIEHPVNRAFFKEEKHPPCSDLSQEAEQPAPPFINHENATTASITTTNQNPVNLGEVAATLREKFDQEDLQIPALQKKIRDFEHFLLEVKAALEDVVSLKNEEKRKYNNIELAQLSNWLNRLNDYRQDIAHEVKVRDQSLQIGTSQSLQAATWRHQRLQDIISECNSFVNVTKEEYKHLFLDEKARKHNKKALRKKEESKRPAERRQKIAKKRMEKEREANIRMRLDKTPKKKYRFLSGLGHAITDK